MYNMYPADDILSHIKNREYEEAAHCTTNTLERVVEKIHPEINGIKKIMNSCGAVSSMMTGSGSAVFGLFRSSSDMDKAYGELKKSYGLVFRTSTVDRGIEIK
jgi:4-diphosphocytidyl-2-C-methyl-D-erythritol kinase